MDTLWPAEHSTPQLISQRSNSTPVLKIGRHWWHRSKKNLDTKHLPKLQKSNSFCTPNSEHEIRLLLHTDVTTRSHLLELESPQATCGSEDEAKSINSSTSVPNTVFSREIKYSSNSYRVRRRSTLDWIAKQNQHMLIPPVPCVSWAASSLAIKPVPAHGLYLSVTHSHTKLWTVQARPQARGESSVHGWTRVIRRPLETRKLHKDPWQYANYH